MKHWKKITAIVVGLVIAAIVAVSLFVNVNTFRPLLEQQLTTALGRKVTMGKLSLSIFSSSVVAQDLTIADDPAFGSAPFLTAKSLHIAVELRPLIFDHKIIVRGIRVDEPQIRLVHADQGLWNFSTLGNTAASRTGDTTKESAIPNLTVDRLKIEGGRATVDNQPSHGAALTFNQIALTVQGFSFSKRFPFTLSASLPDDGTLKLTGQAPSIRITPRRPSSTRN